ncbi:MAG: hypothetical protein M3Z23_05850 [Acidobacteriota bacterium]|nr:hypothetical protein [Acidobacteriota bacterium]
MARALLRAASPLLGTQAFLGSGKRPQEWGSSVGPPRGFIFTVDGRPLAPGTYTGRVTVTSISDASTLTVAGHSHHLERDDAPAYRHSVRSYVDGERRRRAAANLHGDLWRSPIVSSSQDGHSPEFMRPHCECVPNRPSAGTHARYRQSLLRWPAGRLSGTVTVTGGTNSVTVPVSIHIAPGPYHGTITPPVVGTVVSAASGAPGGLRVLFDGIAAPLIYTSLFQTNAVAPYEIAGRQTTVVQVDSGGSQSDPIAIPVAASAPAIFTLDSSGVGGASVRNQDNSINGPSNPAARGSVIQIYATGEGQTDAKSPVLPVSVTIGGADAPVVYAGSAPDSVGLFQVNVAVPQSVETGSAVPLTLRIGDAKSQIGVTVAVQ